MRKQPKDVFTRQEKSGQAVPAITYFQLAT